MHLQVTALLSVSKKRLEIFFRNNLPSVYTDWAKTYVKFQLQVNGIIIYLYQGLSVRGARLLVLVFASSLSFTTGGHV